MVRWFAINFIVDKTQAVLRDLFDESDDLNDVAVLPYPTYKGKQLTGQDGELLTGNFYFHNGENVKYVFRKHDSIYWINDVLSGYDPIDNWITIDTRKDEYDENLMPTPEEEKRPLHNYERGAFVNPEDYYIALIDDDKASDYLRSILGMSHDDSNVFMRTYKDWLEDLAEKKQTISMMFDDKITSVDVMAAGLSPRPSASSGKGKAESNSPVRASPSASRPRSPSPTASRPRSPSPSASRSSASATASVLGSVSPMNR